MKHYNFLSGLTRENVGSNVGKLLRGDEMEARAMAKKLIEKKRKKVMGAAESKIVRQSTVFDDF